jgi:hypothetical protein
MSTDESEKIATLTERMDQLIARLDRFEQTSGNHYVTKAEFEPVRMVVYSMVGICLMAVIGGLLAMVIVKHT